MMDLGEKSKNASLVSLNSMTRLASFTWVVFICMGNLSCSADDDQFVAPGATPKDNGVYVLDTTEIHGFCDFVLESNTDLCWNQNVNAYQNCHYNLLFTRYGNGWTGGDATYSTPLPDGRVVWMFGDTFLGTVKSDRSRSGAPFIRNSFMIQEGDEMVTIHGVEDGDPAALLKPANPEQWYWPLDATVFGNEFQMMLARMGNVGEPGMWSFAYMGFDLAVFSLPDMKLQTLETKFENPEISYGACLMEDDDYTYIYGISQSGFQKFSHVARVPEGNLNGDWTYFNGTSWQDRPSKHIIARDVIDQYAVFKEANKYYLVTQESFLGARIFIRSADSPLGPWTNRKIIYCTPETGGNIITYNAFVHPQLSDVNGLTISYNINSLDFADILSNADYYRPRFLRIENWQ